MNSATSHCRGPTDPSEVLSRSLNWWYGPYQATQCGHQLHNTATSSTDEGKTMNAVASATPNKHFHPADHLLISVYVHFLTQFDTGGAISINVGWKAC